MDLGGDLLAQEARQAPAHPGLPSPNQRADLITAKGRDEPPCLATHT